MPKPKVSLARVFHRGQEIITLSFDKNEEIMQLLRPLPYLRWTKTHSAWYLPYSPGIRSTLFHLLSPVAYVDYSALKNQEPYGVIVPVAPEKNKGQKGTEPLGSLTTVQEEKLKKFREWMLWRRYSESTINTYADALSVFLRYYGDKRVEEINNDDLIRFNTGYILANNCSASYQNQVINAVKLFFRTLEGRQLNPELIHRPKNSKLLPNVLSKEEIKMILQAAGNFKHKAMLSLIYSCGLRRGELLKLRLSDIDAKRMLVIVKQAKGKKDRIVPLSEKILAILREYVKVYAPKYWLFEGQDGQSPYDERSLQNVLKQALQRSKVNKPVTLHWLRHSYATHLLENGTDLRYIQEILGHSSSRTTEIYTHVSTRSIQNVISPYDSL